MCDRASESNKLNQPVSGTFLVTSVEILPTNTVLFSLSGSLGCAGLVSGDSSVSIVFASDLQTRDLPVLLSFACCFWSPEDFGDLEKQRDVRR